MNAQSPILSEQPEALLDFVSAEEIFQITGKKRPADQLRELHAIGLVKAFRIQRGRGPIRLFRVSYDAWLNPAPREPAGAWELDPPAQNWADTPLGRWQQARRESRAEMEQWVRENTPKLTRKEIAQREKAARLAAAETRAAMVRHHTAKRRCSRLQRTPAWAEMDAIKAVYREARRLSKETGIPHHVDHQIPLQGKLVSGLHVHNNLQILTGLENSKKHNRFEIA